MSEREGSQRERGARRAAPTAAPGGGAGMGVTSAGPAEERATSAPAAHRLGPVDEIPVGEGRAYAVGGEQVAVFRLRDGSVRVLSAVCPHAGGALADGQIDDEVLICPLHLHVFELATGCSRTGQPPVRVYQAEIDDRRHVLVRGLG